MTATDIYIDWARYGSWSGPRARGTIRHAMVENPGQWDIVLYGIAVPEGGCYDTVTMYDGTGVTFGLMQWTLTSGRLQSFLAWINGQPETTKDVSRIIKSTLRLAGCTLDATIKGYVLVDNVTGKPMLKAAIRDRFTPPAGKVPRTGDDWKTAKAIASGFKLLGFAIPPLMQDTFAMKELASEARVGRPALRGRSINEVFGLVPMDWDIDCQSDELTPVLALFWSCWQNAPREAERVLCEVDRLHSPYKDPIGFTVNFCRAIARSQYGNWGQRKAALCKKCGHQNEKNATDCVKCKASLRLSRYTKTARAVNLYMDKIGGPRLDPNP